MLNRFSVKGRMYLIIIAILALFFVMVFFAVQNGNRVRDMGLTKTWEVMLADQKAKLQVASHSMAIAVGHAIEGVDNLEGKIEIIRKLIDDIRFESDNSGYYFVYNNTTNVAFPSKKESQGKDLGDRGNPNIRATKCKVAFKTPLNLTVLQSYFKFTFCDYICHLFQCEYQFIIYTASGSRASMSSSKRP
jgi:hypothetical protein